MKTLIGNEIYQKENMKGKKTGHEDVKIPQCPPHAHFIIHGHSNLQSSFPNVIFRC